jgi:hypothetical protein
VIIWTLSPEHVEPDEHGRKVFLIPDLVTPPKPSGFWRTCRDQGGEAVAEVLRALCGFVLIFVSASLLGAAVVFPIYLWQSWGAP